LNFSFDAFSQGGPIMPRWLVVILVLFVGFILLSMAAFLALPFLLQAFLPKVGTVLVYEIEDVGPGQDAAEIAAKTVRYLDLRLNPGLRHQQAKVRLIEGNRIEVGVYGNDPATVRKVEEIIEFTKRLEFRILANVYKHKKEIEIAKNDMEKTTYFDAKGEWSARWIPFKEGEQFDSGENLVRTRKLKDKEIKEVLVVRDPYDLTGDFLISARTGIENGKPCVLFAFSSNGGKLLGMLTGDNLPSGDPPRKNQLGIILNGVMYSAPKIQAVITDSGQITGNFTQSEVDRIVSCLNAGSLPVNLRKVEQRSAGAN
jgi:SecD/SecF fusion protein